MKTYVRFVVFKDEILAVFMRRDAMRRYTASSLKPGQIMPVTGRGWVRQCYAHIGQHGECYDGMQKRKRATPEQYKDLKQEMESIGYDLIVK